MVAEIPAEMSEVAVDLMTTENAITVKDTVILLEIAQNHVKRIPEVVIDLPVDLDPEILDQETVVAVTEREGGQALDPDPEVLAQDQDQEVEIPERATTEEMAVTNVEAEEVPAVPDHQAGLKEEVIKVNLDQQREAHQQQAEGPVRIKC